MDLVARAAASALSNMSLIHVIPITAYQCTASSMYYLREVDMVNATCQIISPCIPTSDLEYLRWCCTCAYNYYPRACPGVDLLAGLTVITSVE